MYTAMEEQINLVSPEAIPALYQYPTGIVKRDMYQYNTGTYWTSSLFKLWEEGCCCFEINNYH
jgi:hypothetical protein